MRVYISATVPMLRALVDTGRLPLPSPTAFALTPTLREAYTAGDSEELEHVAMLAAARGSLRLISAGLAADDAGDPVPRRVVVAADLDGVRPRPDLDEAAVALPGPVPSSAVAAVHVDDPEAWEAVRAAAAAVDAADLGDLDAEFTLGEAEDHQLGWYATQELPFLLDLM